jgi:hypothetical protein
MSKRIYLNQCCGVIIGVQNSQLLKLVPVAREQIEANAMGFANLLKYLRIPTMAVVDRTEPTMPESIKRYLDEHEAAEILEKEFFDLTKHKEITGYLRSTKRKQLIVGGGETDVCILQSCLGLMDLGYEIFLVEDLLFSTSKSVQSAIERLKTAGATLVSIKSLYYEMLEAGESSPQRKKMTDKFGPFPIEL